MARGVEATPINRRKPDSEQTGVVKQRKESATKIFGGHRGYYFNDGNSRSRRWH